MMNIATHSPAFNLSLMFHFKLLNRLNVNNPPRKIVAYGSIANDNNGHVCLLPIPKRSPSSEVFVDL